MKILNTIAILLFLVVSSALAQAPKEPIEGIWQGTLAVGAIQLRLVLKISKNADGTLKATLDSVDQGAKDLPIDTITLKESALSFQMKAIGAAFEGSYNGAEITGEWRQGPGKLPLTFKRSDKEVTVNRPQHPVKPYPYDEQEVSYENKADGIKLSGTLTLPRTKGPHPAVLLITGSGPQDRDETIFAHKPFLVLADHLTRKGMAVLRVDDRGVGGSSAGTAEDTSESYARDVLAGVDYLKTRPEINHKQIGLIGHSEGGLIAPMVAVRSSDIAFIVLMAGPGQRGAELIADQAALISKAAGVSEEQIAKGRATTASAIEIIRIVKDKTEAEKKLQELFDKRLAEIPEAERKAMNISPESLKGQLRLLNSTWFRFFVDYDPRPTIAKVKCPVLAINGALDLQVPAQENIALIAAALKEGGNKDYQALVIPLLNHLFQTAKSGSPAEYGQIEETIAPVALETMSKWILQRVTVN